MHMMKLRPIQVSLAAAAVAGAALLLAACGGSASYPENRGDDSYPLDAMMLTDSDMPVGIARADERAFDNAEWSDAFNTPDPDATKALLDGQKRVRSYVAFFTWDNPQEHLGKVISITSQSTLYEDEASARKSLRENRFSACGLLVQESDTAAATQFAVPKLGDESVGMLMTQQQQQLGKSVDTIVCFRTGRIVHAVQQTGLDGTQNIGLSVKLAQAMLAHVDDAFAGKTPAAGSPTPAPAGASTPAATPSPAATAAPSATPAAGATPTRSGG